MRSNFWVIAVIVLAAAPANADTAVVVEVTGSDLAATRVLADVVTEELRKEPETEVQSGDPSMLDDCKAEPDVCLGLMASISNAKVIILVDVRRSSHAWRVVLTRYTSAARTVEHATATVQGDSDELFLVLRSRVHRFLKGTFGSVGRTGALLVVSDPPGAMVLVDGEDAGVTPRIVDGLYAGPHLVVLRRPGLATATRTAIVTEDSVVAIKVALKQQLEPVPSPALSTVTALGAAIGLGVLSAVFADRAASSQARFDALGEPDSGNIEAMIDLRDEGSQWAYAANGAVVAAALATVATGWLYWQDWMVVNAPPPPPASSEK